jgi:hypothetical protein
VILFGSKRPGKFEFVVDTVFVVVEHRQKFSPANPPNTDEAFRVCTIESLASGGDANTCGTSSACGDANALFTLYSGATYEAPINGMYSFVPCRRADRDDFRFARPTLSLPVDPVNPRNWRTPKISRQLSWDQIREYWTTVRKQVVDDECLIGVHFPTPREDRGATSEQP